MRCVSRECENHRTHSHQPEERLGRRHLPLVRRPHPHHHHGRVALGLRCERALVHPECDPGLRVKVHEETHCPVLRVPGRRVDEALGGFLLEHESAGREEGAEREQLFERGCGDVVRQVGDAFGALPGGEERPDAVFDRPVENVSGLDLYLRMSENQYIRM
jgi:hypothetical protein